MSLFGAFDMEDDPFFGSHMRTMRQMNNMMNSIFADPFGMMGGFGHFNSAISPRGMPNNSLVSSSFSVPMMPNFNRLLSSPLDNLGSSGYSSSSSTIVSMTSGPDGRPQVYKATSSTRCAPGGIKETQRTVTDSRSGTKKMAIGHHIGNRAHIIEKEQNIHTGDREETEELINLDDDEKDHFNREWETKTRGVRSDVHKITGSRNRHSYGGYPSAVPAITAGPSTMAKPYSPPGQTSVRKSKNIKTVSGLPPPADM